MDDVFGQNIELVFLAEGKAKDFLSAVTAHFNSMRELAQITSDGAPEGYCSKSKETLEYTRLDLAIATKELRQTIGILDQAIGEGGIDKAAYPWLYPDESGVG